MVRPGASGRARRGRGPRVRAALRRFLQDKSPSAEVRRLMQTKDGYDPLVWNLMAGQLGLQGLAIPEKFGGSGYGPVEQATVLEEMGRALLCAPYFGTAVLAARALLASGDQGAQEQFLPGIADGSTIATADDPVRPIPPLLQTTLGASPGSAESAVHRACESSNAPQTSLISTIPMRPESATTGKCRK
jgi:hypothetical protein